MSNRSYKVTRRASVKAYGLKTAKIINRNGGGGKAGGSTQGIFHTRHVGLGDRTGLSYTSYSKSKPAGGLGTTTHHNYRSFYTVRGRHLAAAGVGVAAVGATAYGVHKYRQHRQPKPMTHAETNPIQGRVGKR